MRIIIEPTASPTDAVISRPDLRITVEHPSDDLNAEAAVELLRAALLAWGYPPEVLKNYLPEP